MQFSTSCSPFLPANTSVHRVMRQVLIALIPAFTAMFWLFGYTVLLQLLLASSTALLAEVICLRLRKRPVKIHLMDLSALVSAVLLALAIPTIAPWWVSACGALFAIIIGKQVYGGLGYNPFNPAMTGYVFLLISFPQQMTAWQAPDIFISLADALHVIFSGTATIDGLSSATLLDSLKTAGASTALLTEIPSTSTGLLAGAGWELISMAYLLGGLWLLYRKVISWHIPVAVLLGIFMPAGINFFLDANAASSPVFHLFSGASLCGAFFIATDPVSAATSNIGRLIYGGLIGFFAIGAAILMVLLLRYYWPILPHPVLIITCAQNL